MVESVSLDMSPLSKISSENLRVVTFLLQVERGGHEKQITASDAEKAALAAVSALNGAAGDIRTMEDASTYVS